MRDAPDRLQRAMNHCLAQIGIEHAGQRARAVEIGEGLAEFKDYPTPPNCTSPFAPVWIAEMVRRQHAKCRRKLLTTQPEFTLAVLAPYPPTRPSPHTAGDHLGKAEPGYSCPRKAAGSTKSGAVRSPVGATALPS